MLTLPKLLENNLLAFKTMFWVTKLQNIKSADKRLEWFKKQLGDHFTSDDPRYEQVLADVKRY